ncbi:MAG TPA: aldo/keto reductase [Galbitalea sp.]|jgi:aryl-alcohol dehydrogenase-like predicted oxidoreductase|nr:aldo/keto reductase [Galbitalea sp.]
MDAEAAETSEAVIAEDPLAPAFGPRDLGGTGAVVSPIGIDGAVFGWIVGGDETVEILDAFAAGGGNLISTADHYAGGRSEVMIGSWLRTVKDRASIVIETRVGRHPDAAGLGKRSILRAVENSLTRLGTDYIDFLSFDGEDDRTPIEESIETAQRLIDSGVVRYLSAARFSADRIKEVARIAAASSAPSFRVILAEYSLMDRGYYESRLQPIAVDLGRGAIAHMPLANGYLTGRFRTRDELPPSVIYDGAVRHMGRRGDRVLEALVPVAAELGETPTRVALAWVLVKPGIAAAVVRVTDADQVAEAVGAAGVRLARHHVALLDRVSTT